MSKSTTALFIALFAVGCNDSMHVRTPANEPVIESTEEAKPSEPARERKRRDDAEEESATETSKASEDRSGFDADMARILIERARKQAVQCPTVEKETPTGEGDIQLTFDGKNGQIVEVDLGDTFSGGSARGQECLKRSFIGQIGTPFVGRKTLVYALTIPALAAPEKDGKKKKP